MARREHKKSSLTVLVCDDERHIVRLIQVNLERQGYRVLTAFGGNEALAVLGQEKVNILVIDGGLTYPTTREVIEQMRQLPDGNGMQVVVLRSKNDPPPPTDPGDWPNSGPPPVVLTQRFEPAEIAQILSPKKA